MSPFLVSPFLCSGWWQRGQAAGGDGARGGPQDLLPAGLVGIPGKGHHDLCRWRWREGRMQCKSSYNQRVFKLPSFFFLSLSPHCAFSSGFAISPPAIALLQTLAPWLLSAEYLLNLAFSTFLHLPRDQRTERKTSRSSGCASPL